MSNKSYNRGTELLKKKIDSQYEEDPLFDMVFDLNSQIVAKEKENEGLRENISQLEKKLSSMMIEVSQLRDSLPIERKMSEWYRSYWLSDHEKLNELEEKYHRLSLIVRATISPERFLEAEKDLDDQLKQGDSNE